MEVYHHSHTVREKWTHYFWEVVPRWRGKYFRLSVTTIWGGYVVLRSNNWKRFNFRRAGY